MKEKTLALLLGFMTLAPNYSTAQQVASRPVNTEQPVQVKDRAYYKQQYFKTGQIPALEEEAKRTNNANAWAQLCDLYCIAGNFQSSIDSGLKSIKIEPTDWRPYITISTSFRKINDLKNGLSYAAKSLNVAPGEEATNLQMAKMLAWAQRLPEAIAYATKACKINPKSSGAQKNLITIQTALQYSARVK